VRLSLHRNDLHAEIALNSLGMVENDGVHNRCTRTSKAPLARFGARETRCCVSREYCNDNQSEDGPTSYYTELHEIRHKLSNEN